MATERNPYDSIANQFAESETGINVIPMPTEEAKVSIEIDPEDGGVIVDFAQAEMEGSEEIVEWYGDLTDTLEPEELGEIASNVIDNYTIINPNSAQSVTAEYYSGGEWVTFAEHSLGAGSNTEPTTANTGSNGDLVSGANVWRWRGEHPFCLVINDSAADEEALYGWNDGDVEAFFL